MNTHSIASHELRGCDMQFCFPCHSISGDENPPQPTFQWPTPLGVLFFNSFPKVTNHACVKAVLCILPTASAVYDDNTNCIWAKCDGFTAPVSITTQKHLFLKAIKNKQDALEVYCNLWLCIHVRNTTCNSTHYMLGSPMPTLSLKLNLTLILTLTLIQILTLLNLTKPNHSNKMIKYVPTSSPMPCFWITHTLYMRDYILAISLH